MNCRAVNKLLKFSGWLMVIISLATIILLFIATRLLSDEPLPSPTELTKTYRLTVEYTGWVYKINNNVFYFERKENFCNEKIH